MTVVNPSLGALLKEWRLSFAYDIYQWAAVLRRGCPDKSGLSGSHAEIAAFIQTVETTDVWTRANTCAAFDELLDVVHDCVRRPGIDDIRWNNLYLAIHGRQRLLLGVGQLIHFP
jgi:hypothetical protein